MVVNNSITELSPTQWPERVLTENLEKPVIIFKSSNRCSISTSVLSNLKQKWTTVPLDGVNFYLLDVINFRNISNEIAEHFRVLHQSPQILILFQGQCVYDASHFDISYDNIRIQIEALLKK